MRLLAVVRQIYLSTLIRQHLPVGNRRTWSGNRTRTSTSSGGWPSAGRPYWRRAPRPARPTALPASRLWCWPDAVRDGPSPCTRWRWSPVSRSNGICGEKTRTDGYYDGTARGAGIGQTPIVSRRRRNGEIVKESVERSLSDRLLLIDRSMISVYVDFWIALCVWTTMFSDGLWAK